MPTDPTDPFDDVVFDDDFVSGGPKEGTAEERVARAKRIAGANNRLRAAGEIADGSGKPGRRARRAMPWITLAVVIAIVIVIVALVVR